MAANRIKGITVKIGGDTTKLQTALQGVNKEIKSTQSQLKDIEKLLRLDPGNTELLAQKEKLLSDAVKKTKDKLEALKTAAEQANTALANGDISKEQYRNYIGSDNILLDKVTRAVYQYVNAQKKPLLSTWQGVMNSLLTDRYVSQKAEKAEAERARQEAQDEVDYYIGTFDEDNEKLRQQIEELTRTNTSLQMENQGLRAKLSGAEDVPILFLGVEEEFYQGEIKEMILDAIAEKLKNVGQRTRRADVLNDILQNNDYQNVAEERERVVKTMFKDYKTLSASMRQQLMELGFEVTEEGKHYRLTYYGDGRYKTTIAKTGSDWREGKNIASVILKNMM